MIDIDNMPAGPEMNRLMATEVMSWIPMYDRHGELDYWRTGKQHMPCGWSPSTDISAAWEIIKRMMDLGWLYEVGGVSIIDNHYAMFMRGDYDRYDDVWTEEWAATAGTVPLAICRAACKAVLNSAPPSL